MRTRRRALRAPSAGCRCWWKSRSPIPSNRAVLSWTPPRRTALRLQSVIIAASTLRSKAAREAMENGRIGQLAAVECTWAMRKHDAYFDVGWRRRRPGGGPVLINLIHDVDLLRHLCGDVSRVYAEGGSRLRGYQVEDTIAITLRFESGATGTILASDAAPSPWSWELGTGENPFDPADRPQLLPLPRHRGSACAATPGAVAARRRRTGKLARGNPRADLGHGVRAQR